MSGKLSKPSHIRSIGYHNHNDYPVSVSVNGVQHPIGANQPIVDNDNNLVEYHPELEVACGANIIRRIDPDHHQFKDWNKNNSRRQGVELRKFDELSEAEVQERRSPVDSRSTDVKNAASTPNVAMNSDVGAESLPDGVTVTTDRGLRRYTYEGKTFTSLDSINVYKKRQLK